ncbi:MAG: hypothetical protein H7249_08025 [Chitinophagaceae bacterium]|nr:hypothetical protein [Oligoflexus sp.]
MTSELPKQRAQVRKIFKKGDTYQCGLCSKTYGNLEEAQDCLRSDSKAMLNEGGAVETAPKRYRCSFCKRIHSSMDAARACSSDCKTKLEQRMANERKAGAAITPEEKLQAMAQFARDPATAAALQKAKEQLNVSGLSIEPPLKVYKPKKIEILSGENVKFTREKNRFRCVKCRQVYSSADDARLCFDGHGDAPITQGKPKSTDPRYTLDGQKFRCTKCERLYGALTDVISCYDSHAVKPIGKTAKEDDSPAFYRDGAKYVCRKCGKKYFSRDEVIACFENPAEPVEVKSFEPAIEPEPAPVVPAKPHMSKKDEAEIFYRDGAKYVCRGCNKKYFSKDETLACFATHAGTAA